MPDPRGELAILLAIEGKVGRVEGSQEAMVRAFDTLSERLEAHFAEDQRRFGQLERDLAARAGGDQALAHHEMRRSGLLAALVAGSITLIAQLVPHWLK
jgi:hypothetical protein